MSPGPNGTGLIISCGHVTTNLIPVLAGVPDFAKARRIDMGGSHITEAMSQQMHVNMITRRTYDLKGFIGTCQAEQLKHRFCYLAPAFEFANEIRSAYERPLDRRCVIQLPFTPQPVPSEEDLAAKTAMRKEQGRRLQELSAKRNHISA